MFNEDDVSSLSDLDIKIRCPFCREKQWVEVDPTEGDQQRLLIDCQICCRPIEVVALWDSESNRFTSQVSKSSGF